MSERLSTDEIAVRLKMDVVAPWISDTHWHPGDQDVGMPWACPRRRCQAATPISNPRRRFACTGRAALGLDTGAGTGTGVTAGVGGDQAGPSTQNSQPSGVGPQARSGRHPAGGVHPAGGAGQLGGGLKRALTETSQYSYSRYPGDSVVDRSLERSRCDRPPCDDRPPRRPHRGGGGVPEPMESEPFKTGSGYARANSRKRPPGFACPA